MTAGAAGLGTTGHLTIELVMQRPGFGFAASTNSTIFFQAWWIAAMILPYGALAARRIVEPEMMLDLFLCQSELRPLSTNVRIFR
jgi:hypothetical protein